MHYWGLPVISVFVINDLNITARSLLILQDVTRVLCEKQVLADVLNFKTPQSFLSHFALKLFNVGR